ncbi:MAG: HEPN domain-containing protein [Spirochaetales bacterium]|jgi:HEPN domain-containing protein|nr:HEPN domain-containing protein [Spirochaetales bacterium]
MANELLQEWLAKGEEELRSAEYLATMRHPTPDDTICYLCQQSAEKYIKGLLFLMDIEPPRSHDLEELITMCSQSGIDFSFILAKLKILTKYSVITRYPNELNITNDDMHMALQYASDIKDFLIKAITERLEAEAAPGEQGQKYRPGTSAI